MKRTVISLLALIIASAFPARLVAVDPPGILNHQGRVAVNGTNFDGTGQFKFALVDGAGTVLWAHDGSSGEPANAVPVPVAKGLYTVPLGDTAFHANMAVAIPASVFADHAEVRLRIWFSADGGATFELLTPDRRVLSTGYALSAAEAQSVTAGGVTAGMIAAGAVGSAHLAAGAVESGKLADSAVQANHLAANAVTTAAIADGAITAHKFSSGYASGPDLLAGLDLTTTPGMATYSATFPEPFAAGTTPTVHITDGWALDAPPLETGFSASAPYAPVTLDAAGNFAYSSIALVDGRPAIAYADINGADRLVYIIADDASATSWGAPVTVDSGNVGVHCALGVIGGRPAIAYRDSTNTATKFAIASDAGGSSWTTLTIDSGAECNSPSVREVDGKPAVAYLDTAGAVAKYAYASTADGANPGDWTVVTIAPTTDNTGATLAVVDGRPAMAFLDGATGQLQYVRANDAAGASWPAPVPITPAAGIGSGGTYASMAIIAGRPAVAYRSIPENKVYFLRADDAQGSSWGAPALVSSTSAHGNFNSLTVIGGRPALAYGDQSGVRGIVIVLANDAEGTSWGTTCFVEILQARFSSLLDLDGRAAISYLADVPDTLKFAHLPPFPEWTATGNTVFPIIAAGVADGSVTSASIADGTITPQHLALTEDSGSAGGVVGTESITFGQTFGIVPPVTVDAGGFEDAVTVSNRTEASFDLAVNFAHRQIDGATTAAGEYVSMAIVNGRPAVAYWAQGDLLYARAKDAAGNEWNSPVTVEDDGTNNTGYYPTLLEIGGRPAIAYHNVTRGEMRYQRADDADGTAWTATPVTIAAGAAGSYCRGAVIGGRPAVAYWRGGRVYYCRANDANGDSWPAPVLADTFGGGFNMSQQMGLAEVNGLPAIAFVHDNNNLYYARATAVDGSGAWSPTVLPASGNEGLVDPVFYFPITLTVVNGKPAIFFSRRGDYGHRPAMLRAPDASGTTASSWTLTVIDNTASTWNLAAVADLGGTPAVTCREFDHTLRLYRATNADGTAWGPAQVVRTGVGLPAWNSPLEVDGRPAVSYYDANTADLHFATLPTDITWTAATAGAFPIQADSVADGAITSSSIADGAITTSSIGDDAITAAKLADGSVTSAAITDGSIVTADLAANAVTSGIIADGAIKTVDLAANAVTSGIIADGSIGTADLAAEAVTSGNIADGTIATADLAAGAVTAAKLGADVGLWNVAGGDVYRSTGEVGIGTTAPGAALHLKQGGITATDGFRLETSGTSFEDWYFYMNASDDLVIRNDSQDVFSVAKNSGDLTAAGFRTEKPTAGTTFNVIGGDPGNSVAAGVQGAVIGGGGASGGVHTVNRDFGTIGGGYMNTTGLGLYATVAGGSSNSATNTQATVSGGGGNTATGAYSTVSGGVSNHATGEFSAVPGGDLNTASGNSSFAAGRRAKANHHGTFVWGDSTEADFASTGTDQFLIRAGGGVGIGSTDPNAPLHIKTAGDSQGIRLEDDGTTKYWNISYWSDNDLVFEHSDGGAYFYIRDTDGTAAITSDRRLKKDFENLDSALAELARIPVVRYRYKTSSPDVPKTYGFIAQDVEQVFPDLVEEKRGFKTLAISGLTPINTRAIQELKAEKDAEISRLGRENAELKERLEKLEAALEKLAQP
ncbi:MAG: tail fiber domain-containing protein [Akkermansiaceae bacterium]|nr:tail fiber domain-containing protein [Akkermansiaceae bacterium]MCP5549557.1 tail fiber domain-containing protein [Akkermansiaceae bacterium]